MEIQAQTLPAEGGASRTLRNGSRMRLAAGDLRQVALLLDATMVAAAERIGDGLLVALEQGEQMTLAAGARLKTPRPFRPVRA